MSGQNQKNRKNQRKTENSRKNGKTAAKNTRSKTVTAENDSVWQEVLLWVMLAVSIVMFVSNFGIGGKVGNLLSSFLFGVCGLLAYIFPILLFIGTVFVLSNGRNRVAVIKVIAAVLFVCFLCLFLELVSGVTENYSPVNSYIHGMTEHNGGGFLGGLFAWMICPNFGRVSAYVIDFIVLIITMVVVTERSAWKHVQKGGQRVYESAKESNERLHEMQAQRREERALRRMERKVSGVSADTKLTPEKEVYTPTDALTEITPENYGRFPEKQTFTDKTDITGITDAPGAIRAAEPAVTAKHQVSLQPVTEPETVQEEKETIPVFSPELQKLFAQVEPEEVPIEETVLEEPSFHEEPQTAPAPVHVALPEVLPPSEPFPEPEPEFEPEVLPEPEYQPEPETEPVSKPESRKTPAGSSGGAS